jgi:hypothetical protein
MMDDEQETPASPWSGLSLTVLIGPTGFLRAESIYERVEIPEASVPAESIIERLAAVPGRTSYGRQEALRDLFGDDENADAALGEAIADAARKLATLGGAVEEIVSEWEMDRWATLERILKRERELMVLREKLASLPGADTDGPTLRRAVGIAQEELAGLIGLLDNFRLSRRQELAHAAQPESDTPAFTQTESVLHMLQAQQERKKAA